MGDDPAPILLTLKRYFPTPNEKICGTKSFLRFLKWDLIEVMSVSYFPLYQHRNSHTVFLHFSGGPNPSTLKNHWKTFVMEPMLVTLSSLSYSSKSKKSNLLKRLLITRFPILSSHKLKIIGSKWIQYKNELN